MYNLDLQLLVVMILVGSFVDWIFQLEWVFKNKNNRLASKLIRRYTLILHSLAYSIMTYLLTLLIIGRDYRIYIWALLFVSHIIIDNRKPINFILKVKGISEEDYDNYKDYGYMITAIDQRLHEAVIVLIVILENFI